MKTILTLRKTFLPLVFAGTLLLVSGCRLFVVGAAAGAGALTVAYIDGKVEADYGSSYDKVVAAANSAITQLGFSKPEERRDELTDTFTTYNAKGDSIKIVVTRTSDNSSKVTIRVGTFGDRELSMMISDKIKANL